MMSKIRPSHLIELKLYNPVFNPVFINFDCIVTVYTQFGYAQMDVDKYKDDFNPQNMNGGASPEKKPAADG